MQNIEIISIKCFCPALSCGGHRQRIVVVYGIMSVIDLIEKSATRPCILFTFSYLPVQIVCRFVVSELCTNILYAFLE